ncbi:hypothetical protein KY290_009943 [Solanum tuberosum]|uniref:Uncharacterized protein n=1 Tax=Solanum tuberosum TaxID=4113 RepID=A0ABQ7VWC4_SOLTU|nr:hypothetical protein KY284_009897 [Solanum tuberosum]KAH0772806.1 hypothetical protein KY290_009943 [Solanum tuberosum]
MVVLFNFSSIYYKFVWKAVIWRAVIHMDDPGSIPPQCLLSRAYCTFGKSIFWCRKDDLACHIDC